MIKGFGNAPPFEYDENGNPIRQVDNKPESWSDSAYSRYKEFRDKAEKEKQERLAAQKAAYEERERLKKLKEEGKYVHKPSGEIEKNSLGAVFSGMMQGPADAGYYLTKGADYLKEKVTGEGFLSEDQKKQLEYIKENPYEELLGEGFNREYNVHKELNPNLFTAGEVLGPSGVYGGAKLLAKGYGKVGGKMRKRADNQPLGEVMSTTGKIAGTGALIEGGIEPALDKFFEEQEKKKKKEGGK